MVMVVIPISFMPVISKTARDRDSVLTGHYLPPQPYIKAEKKFTRQIYALSECLLVCTCAFTADNCTCAEFTVVFANAVDNVGAQVFCNTQLRIMADRFLNIGKCSAVMLCIRPDEIARKCFHLHKHDFEYYITPVPTCHEFD